ncbi:zinc finger BED domain-containing protein 5-like [Oopsacas minuta]|uniref:Zinc finger BED domain-containing protein 5-like n=1 Tax=Oopsacas minuta TaxID=111878 RepID=A0AAV7JFM0_9METZ|nr:zinc finger BED domain-containing protein 5-like [Oopsacas minuta]
MESAKKRKYNEDYIKYGFTSILKEGRELPQCVICYKVLSEGSVKPSFLKRHLSGCHPNLADKDIDFFKHQEVGVKRIRIDHRGQLSQQTQAGLRASYMVALRIAQEKKPHTIAENLILPCCKDIVHCIWEIATKRNSPLCLSLTSQSSTELQIWQMALSSSYAQLLVFARTSKTGNSRKSSYFSIAWKQLQKVKMSSSRSLISWIEWEYPGRMFLLAQQMVLLPMLTYA